MLRVHQIPRMPCFLSRPPNVTVRFRVSEEAVYAFSSALGQMSGVFLAFCPRNSDAGPDVAEKASLC